MNLAAILSGLRNIVIWVPRILLIVFYLPAIGIALGGIAIFAGLHRWMFGYPTDKQTVLGRVGSGIWMPFVVTFLILAAGVAIAETFGIVWLLISSK